MSVPVQIETFVVDGTPQSVVPLIFSIDSKCIERQDVVASYAIIPGYASADCFEDTSSTGSFLDPRTTYAEAYATDAPRINGNIVPITITAESVATTPINYSEAQALAESAAPFYDSDDASSTGVESVTASVTVNVQDGNPSQSFINVLESVYITAASVGTGNTEKTASPLPFTADVEKYYSPDEIAFDERLEDVSITATSTGVLTPEPLKPKVIEAYSGQSADDTTTQVGNTQGFFWG